MKRKRQREGIRERERGTRSLAGGERNEREKREREKTERRHAEEKATFDFVFFVFSC